MTAEARRNFRIAILLGARRAPLGATVELARLCARTLGMTVGEQEARDEIAYLADKGLLAPVDQTISPELAAWRITAGGRDWLATEGHE